MNGEHVMIHRSELRNEIWSDMFIESTFMRYGHGPGSLMRITLSLDALKMWELSLHLCSCLIKDVADLRNED